MRVLTLILVTAILIVLPETGIAGDPDKGNRGPVFREIIGTGGDDQSGEDEIIGTGGDDQSDEDEIIGAGGHNEADGPGRIGERSFWFWLRAAWSGVVFP